MHLNLPQFFTDYLIKRAMRTPYFHLEGYMERYWLVPFTQGYNGQFTKEVTGCYNACPYRQPVTWALQQFGIGIRIHKILRSDDARAFHNHPWNFISIILKGRYTEVTPVYDDSDFFVGTNFCSYEQGDVLFRKSNTLHRLVLAKNKPVWTLFITGKKQRTWGFLTQPKFLTKHYEYDKNV